MSSDCLQQPYGLKFRQPVYFRSEITAHDYKRYDRKTQNRHTGLIDINIKKINY